MKGNTTKIIIGLLSLIVIGLGIIVVMLLNEKDEVVTKVNGENKIEVNKENKDATENVITGSEITKLVQSGNINEVEEILNSGNFDKSINKDVIRSYIEFVKSTDLVSLKTSKLMDSVDYEYSGILKNEIQTAIYTPHESNSIITGIFPEREGYDYLDWKYNDLKDAYIKAKDYKELYAQVQIEKSIKEMLIEQAKGKNPHLGMSKEEVEVSLWGKPNDINRTVTQYGTHEQWVYGNGQYLYFEDGILTGFQD